MPGHRGKKMIERKSKSGKFKSVKALVFSLLEKNPKIEREEAEKIVMKEYPKSNFVHKGGKGGHWPWYLHKWKKNKLENEFILKEQSSKEIQPIEVKDEKARTDVSKKGNIRTTSRIESKRMGKLLHRTEN